ncbi:hypothetical protein FA13DRAFT_160335 [Coprinellus micaceus]|uniref:Uncharacterized protein n=1 Tax=Coprinellus micaceus TaxID=71717 RepID=A0A4Y7TH89_COPMI|nr:hypothetical protein FA13DRAFT_160335 [Coprinellus micaceus]
MAEQESKARIHFTQVAQLARRLDRVLVLPNVGKSRMGACYKYPFETYYDASPFFYEAPSTPDAEFGGAGYVKLEDFRAWSEAQRKPVRSRLLSVAASTPQDVLYSAAESLEENNDLVIHQYPTEIARETGFPGCFPSKWTQLELGETSMFVALDSQSPSVASPMEFGELLVSKIDNGRKTPRPDLGALHTHPNELQEALQPPIEPDLAMRDPDVLILNWDLRRPIFSPDPLSDVSLQYSPLLQDLATKLAPSSPYLAIHWRMETVDVDVLGDCAHSLVAVLSDLLHDTGHLGLGVKKVWFASDYPYPIASPYWKYLRGRGR